MWLRIKLGANLPCDVIGNFEEAVGSSTLCMHNSLWDTFSSEMCHLVHKVEILHEERAARTNR